MSRKRQLLVLVAVLALALLSRVVDEGNGQPVDRPPVDIPAGATDVAAALSLAVPSGDTTFTGVVEHISDGDTLVVTVQRAGPGTDLSTGDRVTIRLLRIDTPELERDDQPLECWAERATSALATLAPEDSMLTLQLDAEHQDQYGRTLAHLWNEAGVWVNGALLADGHARVVTFRPNVAHDQRVHELEDVARQRGLGLWGSC